MCYERGERQLRVRIDGAEYEMNLCTKALPRETRINLRY